MMNQALWSVCIVALLCAVNGLPRSGIRRSLLGHGGDCSRASLESFCTKEDELCLRTACSHCILRDPFNPFSSFCMRLTTCVCSISPDADCVAKIENGCY
ncbi:unnamed protein product [Caenorhabditis auriculariae]|uniref:Uncharacterized protein n=1 Tax=Caenorhabditis auriculariae TaxID=2777116 RepID=A0A8S1H345_9PELO|nr:unnamed protein product [Caenorhabditis auriculariae]